MDQARGKVLIIAAQVEALDEEIQDELDGLKLERRRRAVQLDKARAQAEVAIALVARDRRLKSRNSDMVTAEEVAKHEAEYKVAMAESRIVEAEVTEVDLRIGQLERKRDRIRDVAKLAERAKKNVQPESAGTQPVPNAPAPPARP